MGHPNYRRGAQALRLNSNTPRMHELFGAVAPSPIGKRDWSGSMGPLSDLGNTIHSDCVYAMYGHMWQLWTANNGAELAPDTASTLANYSRRTGFTAGPPPMNDNGEDPLAANQYAMTTGLAVKGNAALRILGGSALIEPGDCTSVMRAIDLFGCADALLNLPDSAESDFEAGREWSDLSGVGGEGHDTLIVAYDSDCQRFKLITWGHFQFMSFSYWRKYSMGGFAHLSRDWIGPCGLSPSGLSMTTLDGMVRTLGGNLGAFS